MPSKYDVQAAHVLNEYLWDMLQSELGDNWKTIPGWGTPILPAQEQPEVTDSGYNYITFIYMDRQVNDLFVLREQSLEWSIYSKSPFVVSQAIALCRDLFGDLDAAAQRINKWLATKDFHGTDNSYDQFYKNYRFKTIRFEGSTSAQPAEESAGTMDGLVSLSCKFVQVD